MVLVLTSMNVSYLNLLAVPMLIASISMVVTNVIVSKDMLKTKMVTVNKNNHQCDKSVECKMILLHTVQVYTVSTVLA